MVVDALLEGRLADVEGECLLVSSAIWRGAVCADTRVGEGVLVQRSAQITTSSFIAMWAIMETDEKQPYAPPQDEPAN